MSLYTTIRRGFNRITGRQPAQTAIQFTRRDRHTHKDGVRHLESTETHRLNEAHWARVTGENINQWIGRCLLDSRQRCRYEAMQNDLAQGVVETYVTDLVGAYGPTLNVQSEDERFDQELESLFNRWWQMPDVLGRMSGVDFLNAWVRGLWTDGEFLSQFVSDQADDDGNRLRLHQIDPARLMETGRTGSTCMGIELDSIGRRLAYWIANDDPCGAVTASVLTKIPATQIIHQYKMLEAGQLRGLPWLQWGLTDLANLRDYDAEVMQAARQQANMSMYWFTRSPDIPAVAVAGETDREFGTSTIGPPGYEVAFPAPTQPLSQFTEYHEECERGIGRAVGMPLFKVRLDSSKHSYASARIDQQGYQNQITAVNAWLSRAALNPVVKRLAREAILRRALRPVPPGGFMVSWVWPKLPHVDPSKEADAEDLEMHTNKTKTLGEALAERGKTLEGHCRKLVKEAATIQKEGAEEFLKPAPPPAPMVTPAHPEADDEPADDTEEDTDNVEE